MASDHRDQRGGEVPGAFVVCWNCESVVPGHRPACPRCKSGLVIEGRGTAEERFRDEQEALQTYSGIPESADVAAIPGSPDGFQRISRAQRIVEWIVVPPVSMIIGVCVAMLTVGPFLPESSGTPGVAGIGQALTIYAVGTTTGLIAAIVGLVLLNRRRREGGGGV